MKKYALLLVAALAASGVANSQDLALSSKEIFLKEEIRFAPKPQEAADLNQDRVYQMNWKVDAPVTAVGALWSGYAFTKIYRKDPIPDSVVAKLTKEDVNGFDRWAAGMNDDKIDDISDYLFYGSMPLAALLFIDKKNRRDAPKIGFLYLESFAITGTLYTGATYFTNRFKQIKWTEQTVCLLCF